MDGLPGLPTPVSPLARMSDQELRFYETTLLQMHREIFQDEAVMHEAYLANGMRGIGELREAGIIDDQTEQAWATIDRGVREGNRGMIASGNTRLLYREQHDIIQDDYARLYNHPGTGRAFTYMMTTVGEPSIPGAKTFAQYSPVTVTVQSPGPRNLPIIGDNPLQGTVTVQTPFPRGNVAIFDDRWTYLLKDSVPAYQNLLEHDPGRVRQIISTDVGERIEQYRLPNTAGRTLQRMADWRMNFRQ